MEEKKKNTGSISNSELDALMAEAVETGAPVVTAKAPAIAAAFSISPEIFSTLWKVIFGVVARNAGEHWNLNDAEARQLGELSAPLADKWLPAAMSKYGAEFALASCLIFMAIDKMQRGRALESGDSSNPRQEGLR